MTSANTPDGWEDHVQEALDAANKPELPWWVDDKPVPVLPGFYLEPLTGYRAWSITKDGLLGPVATGVGLCMPSKPRPATCRYGHDRAPRVDCTCGYYAFKDPGSLLDMNGGTFYAFSAVRLWGRIIEHEKGYRAEYCYPKGRLLIFAAGEDETLQRLNREIADAVEFYYGIPTHIITSDSWITDDF